MYFTVAGAVPLRCRVKVTYLGIEKEHSGFSTEAPVLHFHQFSILQVIEFEHVWVMDGCVMHRHM